MSVGESPILLREGGSSVACGPSVHLQAGGLIAVGQRLAPMSKARSNQLKEETLVIFFRGLFWAPHVVRSLGRPQ